MSRTLSGLANTALFVLCCFLVANTANTVFAALLAEPAALVTPAPVAAAASTSKAADSQVILERNLFNASLLAPPAPERPEPEIQEELEATKLPLTLIGTVASPDPRVAWAAIQDLQERKTLVVQVDDPVKRGATVMAIERRRVVLLENGKPRELRLDDDNEPILKPKVANRRAPRRPKRAAKRQDARAERLKRLADNRYEVERDTVEDTIRNPASLFSQAQIQPKYEDGEMVGMQVNAIKPGSLFEEIGIESGEIITEVNGISITSPEESGKILAEFAEAPELTVVLDGDSGERTVTFSIPEEE